MEKFTYVLRNDYDKRVCIDGENILCYSAKRLKSLHPELDKKGCKEARAYSKAERKPAKDGGPSRYQRHIIGEMPISIKNIGVSGASANNPFLYKKVGYVCLADGSYVALCVSRVPFLLILSALALLLVATAILLFSLLGEEPPDPLHPLPPIDDNLVPDDNDSGEPPKDAPEGGGVVSMIYTLSAKITLSTGDIKIHFKNPKASNHSVSMQFYIISAGGEYLIAESGLIPAGNGLYTLKMSASAPALSEGKYEGMYRVMYYDPVTGIRANVQSDVADVVVSVNP